MTTLVSTANSAAARRRDEHGSFSSVGLTSDSFVGLRILQPMRTEPDGQPDSNVVWGRFTNRRAR